ncbi:hypothetical protein [Winogradskyella sp. PE311]|uniref:hypothetical protein n=1 Tax=Winogradskyella sp. PE311 TaxID=3366943 RepID=UPI00397EFFA8
MKSIIYLVVFCFSCLFGKIEAQTQIVKDSMSIAKVVGLQEKVDYKNFQVKFKKVIADSRCPKHVMCVRAGEADVLVSIYKNENFVGDKKIRIDASGYVMESNNLAFDAKDFKIYGFALTPYPTGTDDTTNANYELELVFKPKVLK